MKINMNSMNESEQDFFWDKESEELAKLIMKNLHFLNTLNADEQEEFAKDYTFYLYGIDDYVY